MSAELAGLETIVEAVAARTDVDSQQRVTLLRDALHPAAPASPALACPPSDVPLILRAVSVAVFDSTLRPSAQQLLLALAWRYVPGEIWFGDITSLAREIGLESPSGRTERFARQQLVAGNHIEPMSERRRRGERRGRTGWIISLVDTALPADRRATPDGAQLRLPLLALARAPLQILDSLASAARPVPAEPARDVPDRPAEPAPAARDVPDRPAEPAPAARDVPDRPAEPAPAARDVPDRPAEPAPAARDVPDRPAGLTRASEQQQQQAAVVPETHQAFSTRVEGMISVLAIRTRDAGRAWDETAVRERIRTGAMTVADLQAAIDEVARALAAPAAPPPAEPANPELLISEFAIRSLQVGRPCAEPEIRERIQTGAMTVADLQAAIDEVARAPLARTVWMEMLGRIETKVNRYNFNTWFGLTALVEDTGKRVTVRALNELCRDWLTEHYAGEIQEAAVEVGRGAVEVVIVAGEAA